MMSCSLLSELLSVPRALRAHSKCARATIKFAPAVSPWRSTTLAWRGSTRNCASWRWRPKSGATCSSLEQRSSHSLSPCSLPQVILEPSPGGSGISKAINRLLSRRREPDGLLSWCSRRSWHSRKRSCGLGCRCLGGCLRVEFILEQRDLARRFHRVGVGVERHARSLSRRC